MAYLAFLESMRGFWLWSARIYSGSVVSAEDGVRPRAGEVPIPGSGGL
jgi:hypothetical protein